MLIAVSLPATMLSAQDADRTVKDGGVKAAGWTSADKLASTDGIYGIRVSHNLELTVTGLAKSKP